MTLHPTSATREQVLSFRLRRHHLAQRLPAEALLEVAGACGIQDSPPGSAGLALLARLDGLTPDRLNHALAVDKSLLQIWSLRASPYVVPTKDVAVFTHGLLPPDEESLRFFITGARAHLDAFQMSASELVRRMNQALLEVLDGSELTKDALGVALAQKLAADLPEQHLAQWNSPDGYGANTYGETLARFAMSVSALHGLICLAPRKGRAATFVRTDQWLGVPTMAYPAKYPDSGYAQTAQELARRYLHCYGPSHVTHFAAWAGIAPSQAAQTWKSLELEIVPVRILGQNARTPLWLLEKDLSELLSPVLADGVRLLPPHDPFLQLRDRQLLVADPALQRRIWQAIGNPGAVLAAGRLAGLWRPEKKGTRLTLSVEQLAPLESTDIQMLESEAEAMAAWRGCSQVAVQIKSQ